jgi:hypothetical protein
VPHLFTFFSFDLVLANLLVVLATTGLLLTVADVDGLPLAATDRLAAGVVLLAAVAGRADAAVDRLAEFPPLSGLLLGGGFLVAAAPVFLFSCFPAEINEQNAMSQTFFSYRLV